MAKPDWNSFMLQLKWFREMNLCQTLVKTDWQLVNAFSKVKHLRLNKYQTTKNIAEHKRKTPYQACSLYAHRLTINPSKQNTLCCCHDKNWPTWYICVHQLQHIYTPLESKEFSVKFIFNPIKYFIRHLNGTYSKQNNTFFLPRVQVFTYNKSTTSGANARL